MSLKFESMFSPITVFKRDVVELNLLKTHAHVICHSLIKALLTEQNLLGVYLSVNAHGKTYLS
jgi:hypothetical protein